MDKHRKTHPWRVRLLRDVTTTMRFADGSETPFRQSAGERMCRTKREADEFHFAISAECGADAVGPVHRVPPVERR